MLHQGEEFVDAGMGAPLGDLYKRVSARPLYTRSLPGGGFVRVELVEADASAGAPHRCGRVVIEPRESAPRLAADQPLVVEELEGDDEGVLVTELIRIARDNAAIARRVLRRRSASQRAD